MPHRFLRSAPVARRAGAALVAFGAATLACAAPSGARSASPLPNSSGNDAADRAAVLATIDTMLQGMRAKDGARIAAQFDSLARMTLLRPARTGGVRVVALSGTEFVRLATAEGQPGIDEPIRNPVVQIDGDLATVWAEYQVRVAGRVTHCGHDAFHLVRRAAGWRVLNVSDTYRQTGCGPAW